MEVASPTAGMWYKALNHVRNLLTVRQKRLQTLRIALQALKPHFFLWISTPIQLWTKSSLISNASSIQLSPRLRGPENLALLTHSVSPSRPVKGFAGAAESRCSGEAGRCNQQGAGEGSESALSTCRGFAVDLQRLKRDTESGRSAAAVAESHPLAQGSGPVQGPTAVPGSGSVHAASGQPGAASGSLSSASLPSGSSASGSSAAATAASQQDSSSVIVPAFFAGKLIAIRNEPRGMT